MTSATRSNSASPKPRVVSAGVPSRRPVVYHGDRGSVGIEFRLGDDAVVQQVLGGLAVQREMRRSTSTR